jgi:hypothetical protein
MAKRNYTAIASRYAEDVVGGEGHGVQVGEAGLPAATRRPGAFQGQG